jgi:rhamnogalacturonan acetylesterase
MGTRAVTDVRDRGASPILCSLVPRKIWKDGHIVRDEHADWTTNTPFLDLKAIVARKYEALGPEKVNELFADEHTHTTPAGAQLNATSVIDGLKALDNPLVKYFAAATTPSPSSR